MSGKDYTYLDSFGEPYSLNSILSSTGLLHARSQRKPHLGTRELNNNNNSDNKKKKKKKNPHQTVMRAIDQQQPTTPHLHNTRVDQRPRLLRVVHEVVVGLVAELFGQRG